MTIEAVRKLIDGAQRWHEDDAPMDDATAPFSLVDLSALDAEQTEPTWAWGGLVPHRHVTLLAGHGGAGKSWLALQLAACAAIGTDCLGRAVPQGKVLLFSAEDSTDLVLRRLRSICRKLGVSTNELQARLQVVDASAAEPLFVEVRANGVRCGVSSPTFDALAALVRRESYSLIVIDNATDVFAGDEINRQQVRAFVRSLATLARDGAGIVLVCHVDKSTSRAGTSANGESYSGSTSWHNSVRSRLHLLEVEPGLLELRHEKCNIAPRAQTLRLEWPQNGLIQLPQGSGAVAAIERRTDRATLLKLIHEFYSRGEYIATGPTSPSNAARLLAREPGYPRGLKPGDAFGLLRSAERDGLLARETYRTVERKPRERWGVTLSGRESIGAPTAPTAPTTEDCAVGSGVAPTAPTPTGGVGGGARTKHCAKATP